MFNSQLPERHKLRNEISRDLDALSAARKIHIHQQIISCRRAKHLEQLVSCHTRSVTVQSRFQETAKDSSAWLMIAALVRLNWRLRNVLTYLLTYLQAH